MAGYALCCMVRAPEPGSVKTRLTPPLTPIQASGLYRCFVKDTLRRVGSIRGLDTYIAYTPPDGRMKIYELISQGMFLTPQKGRTLGDRLYNVFSYLFGRGYSGVCVIGSDSPDLPLEYIEESIRLIRCGDGRVVLGPARDGGYYLVSMNLLTPVPFEGIPWSTERVLDETIKKVKRAGLGLRLLEPWYDIDSAEDLYLLRDNPDIPATAEYLRKNGILT